MTVVPDPSPTQSESPGIEDLNQGSTLKDDVQEATDQVMMFFSQMFLSSSLDRCLYNKLFLSISDENYSF